MTFKIKISQFYDSSEPKKWKWNIIRHFLKDILKSEIIFHWSQNAKLIQWVLLLESFNFGVKVSTNKQSEIKLNKVWANLRVFFLIYKAYTVYITPEIYFLIGFINSSGEKMSFIQFNFANIKRNWTPLAEKNSQLWAKITLRFRLSWNWLNCIIMKTF